MIQRYRIYAAMLELREEFTVETLAESSGANPNTVRTILNRSRELVEGVGQVETGRRGGRPTKYRLRPEGREELEHRLAELERLGREKAGPPSELVAAEHLLVDELPGEADPETRQSLLRRSRRLLRSGRETVAAHADGSEERRQGDAHRIAVELLLRIADAEARDDQERRRLDWDAARVDLAGYEHVLRSGRTSSTLYELVRLRLLESAPAAQPAAAPATDVLLREKVRDAVWRLTRTHGQADEQADATGVLSSAARLARDADIEIMIRISPPGAPQMVPVRCADAPLDDVEGCRVTVQAQHVDANDWTSTFTGFYPGLSAVAKVQSALAMGRRMEMVELDKFPTSVASGKYLAKLDSGHRRVMTKSFGGPSRMPLGFPEERQ